MSIHPGVGYRALDDSQSLALITARLGRARGHTVSSEFDTAEFTGEKFTALGACIFAGAFSLGVEAAGFAVAGHLELPDLQLGSWVSRQRWPVSVLPGESEDPGWASSWQGWGAWMRETGRSPDFLYANPPCVAYAGTGKRQGSADDRMCYTRLCTYGLAWALQPTVWAWELVPGVFDHERGLLEAMALRARRLGYKCHAFLTSSSMHGGFQDRRRFHFIASKVELDFEGVYAREPESRRGVRTVDQALRGLKLAEDAMWERDASLPKNRDDLYAGAFKSLMPYTAPGTRLREVPPSVMSRVYKPRGVDWRADGGVPGFAHQRARGDRPSPNVLGGHTIVHPHEDRYMTARECATLMGFPVDYEFSPGTKAYREIGCGLCTHNAEFVARVVHDGLSRGVPAEPHQAADGSWLHSTDWRPRAPRLNMSLPRAEREAWWRARHGELPPEGVP